MRRLQSFLDFLLFLLSCSFGFGSLWHSRIFIHKNTVNYERAAVFRTALSILITIYLYFVIRKNKVKKVWARKFNTHGRYLSQISITGWSVGRVFNSGEITDVRTPSYVIKKLIYMGKMGLLLVMIVFTN